MKHAWDLPLQLPVIYYYFKIKDLLRFYLFLCLFIYLTERERAHKQGKLRAGEGEADSPLSKEPDTGLHLRTLRCWPELEANT